MRLLVVEDDEDISERLKHGLTRCGFDVDLASDGEAGLAAASHESYDLILLDLMLPLRDGWSLCQTLRSRRNNVPILMLTARDAVDDRVRGLDAGADDYLPKPFDFRELEARVRALLRRDKMHRTRHIKIADLTLDTAAKAVSRAGQVIHLTPREYALLEALVLNEGRTVSRQEIIDRIWRDDTSLSDTVSFHVNSLRRKVDAEHEIKLIHTVHGVGYVLRQPAGDAT
jgi:two-component system copper resistance phosphate regulon response regulator CusR